MRINLLAAFFFIIGISSGVFTSLMINPDDKIYALDYFNNYIVANTGAENLYFQIFFCSLLNNFSLLLIIIICGLFARGYFLSYGVITFKGLALGLSVSLILVSMKFKGALLILFSVVPQNLIFIPALICAISFSKEKSPGQTLSSYFKRFIVLAILILAGCLLESFLAPVLTRLII